MRVAMVINARNKEKYIAQSVIGSLSQTYPCEVVISDQGSTDQTLAIIEREVMNYQAQADSHRIKIVQCPITGPYGMRAANEHFDWAWRQSSPECSWIFQSSGDDFSLPDRVKVCMEAVEKNPCSAVATTMFFAKPGESVRAASGYPTETGYVKAGEGLKRLAYGSCIAGYRRDFLEKVSAKCGPNTPDVLLGFMAALMDGFYVVANPQHVHQEVADSENTGFQGKLRAATGDMAMKVAELNHLQLMRLYFACGATAHDLGIAVPSEDWNALIEMILTQAHAWMNARLALHEKGLYPEIMPV